MKTVIAHQNSRFCRVGQYHVSERFSKSGRAIVENGVAREGLSALADDERAIVQCGAVVVGVVPALVGVDGAAVGHDDCIAYNVGNVAFGVVEQGVGIHHVFVVDEFHVEKQLRVFRVRSILPVF